MLLIQVQIHAAAIVQYQNHIAHNPVIFPSLDNLEPFDSKIFQRASQHVLGDLLVELLLSNFSLEHGLRVVEVAVDPLQDPHLLGRFVAG